MKKIKLLVILLLAILVIPFVVNAEETTGEEVDNRVNVYLFRGETCPHCKEAEEWFASIQEEYGSKFKVVDYEVWYNEDNSKLMDKVAKARGEDVQGVPYIIIGKNSWNGFAETYTSEMLSQIDSEYAKDISDRYDIMKLIDSGAIKEKDTTGNDILSLVIILVIVGGVIFGIYKARTIAK